MEAEGDVSVENGFTKANTIDTTYAEDRRESFGKSRSASESSNNGRTSQRNSIRTESISEEESNEQKSASNLKSMFENKSSDNAKSYNRTKAVGGQAGANSLKERFENPNVQQPRRPSSSRINRLGSIDAEGESKKVSTSAIRARFEQKAVESSPKRNFVINRGKAGDVAKKFNQAPAMSNKCFVCGKVVYPMEKVEVEGTVYHKFCFKCETCKRTLSLGNFAALQGKLYCKPHLKQLFKLKGNYDEGFGREQRKADWVKNDDDTNAVSSNPAAAQSNDETVERKTSNDESKVNGHHSNADVIEEDETKTTNGFHSDEETNGLQDNDESAENEVDEEEEVENE